MGWVANFLKGCVAVQENILYDYPEEKRKAGYGRAASLVIAGENGGIFDLWFCEQGVRPKPDSVEIKNTVYMTEDTLLDLVTPDFERYMKENGLEYTSDLEALAILVEDYNDLPERDQLARVSMTLYPRLDFRTALANDLIKVSGDKPDVDSEEWSRILENVILKVAFPIIIKGLLKRAKRGGKHGVQGST